MNRIKVVAGRKIKHQQKETFDDRPIGNFHRTVRVLIRDSARSAVRPARQRVVGVNPGARRALVPDRRL